MVPADQRLESAYFAARKVYDRLVIELELAGRQRPAQIVFHRAACLHLEVHRWLKKPEHAASIGLGAVQRKVGITQQLLGCRAIAWTDRNPDAGADHRLIAVNVKGF